jgi:hypothetical protein
MWPLIRDKVIHSHYYVTMPDLDRLPRGLRPAWRAVADALRGQQPPSVVGDAVEKALARTIRRTGGLYWVMDLAQAVAACRQQGSLVPLEKLTASLEPTRATGVGGAFIDAAWTLAATDDVHPEAESTLHTLVRTGLERMVDKLCVGPLEPDLVPAVFPSATAMATYIEECLSEVQLDKLAKQMTRTGCSGHIRAPRTRLSRPGTKGLIHEPIV